MQTQASSLAQLSSPAIWTLNVVLLRSRYRMWAYWLAGVIMLSGVAWLSVMLVQLFGNNPPLAFTLSPANSTALNPTMMHYADLAPIHQSTGFDMALLSPQFWLVLLALLGCIGASVFGYFAQSRAVTAVAVAPGTAWHVRDQRGIWHSGIPLAFARGSCWLRVRLQPCDDGTPQYRHRGRAFWCTLWRDSMPPLLWRRLQVVAMWFGLRRISDVHQQEYV